MPMLKSTRDYLAPIMERSAWTPLMMKFDEPNPTPTAPRTCCSSASRATPTPRAAASSPSTTGGSSRSTPTRPPPACSRRGVWTLLTDDGRALTSLDQLTPHEADLLERCDSALPAEPWETAEAWAGVKQGPPTPTRDEDA